MPEFMHYGNQIASVDFETTGLIAGWHEICQIAIVPLDENLDPRADVKPFYTNMKPRHKERMDPRASAVHKLTWEVLEAAPDPDKVQEWLLEYIDDLELPFQRCLIPMVHNYPNEYGFASAWLGGNLRNKVFHGHYRDAMAYAIGINDRFAYKGRKIPFPKLGLDDLCSFFGIKNEHAHDALADAIVEPRVYKALMDFDSQV